MEAVLFFACAIAAVVGALGVVLGRNPVHSALFLLMTLVTMAVFFLMNDADLVAIIQIVVYASAIVVLFLFVITLLGVDQKEPWSEFRQLQTPIAVIVGVILAIQVAVVIVRDNVTGAPSQVGPLDEGETGNVERLAEHLFTDYLWAFEITAVLLVIAVVGGVVLARRSGHRPVAGRGAEQ